MLPEASRLVFHEFRDEDLPELAGLLADPQVMRYSWQGPRDQADSRKMLAVFKRTHRELGFGKWALTLRASGEFVGYCGLERCIVEGVKEIELGYRLKTKFWGRGLASEATVAVLRQAFEVGRLPHVVAFLEPANVASVRVLEKSGFRRITRSMPMNGKIMDVYRIDAPK